MIERYAYDLMQIPLRLRALLNLVGNSYLEGTFVENVSGVAVAAEQAGMAEVEIRERDPTANSRYLPITDDGSLSKRMRMETVLTFRAD